MSLRDLYQTYHQQIQFLVIYIREAHPVDGWWFGKGLAARLAARYAPGLAAEVYDPQTIKERRAVAGACETTRQLGIRTYVDEMDDPVSKAYAARPTRLYLVGTDGRVAYAGGLGPFGFKPAELKDAIEQVLLRST